MSTSPSGTNIPLSSDPKITKHRARNAVFTIIGLGALMTLLVLFGISRHGRGQTGPLSNGDGAVPHNSSNAADEVTNSLSQDHAREKHQPPSQSAPGDIALKPPQPGGPAANMTAGAGAIPQQPELSPSEQARLDSYQSERDAMTTPLLTAEISQSAPAPAAMPYSPPQQPAGADILSTLAAVLGKPRDSQPANPELAAPKPAPDVPAPYVRKPPPGRFVLSAGTWLPVRLDMAFSSEVPGQIQARITADVRDRLQNLMLPMGSVVIGDYGARVAYGQGRVVQVWNRIVFPDASSITLDDLQGHASDGSAGLTGHVNNHFGRILMNAALTTVFAAGIAVSQRQNASILAAPSVGTTISQAAGSNLAEVSSEMTRRGLDIAPTVSIKPGVAFFIPLSRDIVFDAPYTSQ